MNGVATGYTYNAASQLTAVTGPGAGTYTYDANGNQTTGGGRTATYNDRDQTTTVNTTAAGYEDIDHAQRATLGTRSFLNTPLGVTRYTDPAATTDVIREPTGQLAALRRPGSTHYPITDALGSVIAQTDAARTKTDTFSYDPYGADTGRTGTTENPFRFTGEHRDPTDVYKFGVRSYDPIHGQFTQPDPLSSPGSSCNRSASKGGMLSDSYAYVDGDPINNSDPTGYLPRKRASAYTTCMASCVAMWCGGKANRLCPPVLPLAVRMACWAAVCGPYVSRCNSYRRRIGR